MYHLKKQAGLIVVILLILVGFAPAASAQGPYGEIVTVIYGDTLQAIADRYNTTVKAIMEANPSVTNPDQISVGQPLHIPGSFQPQQRDTAFWYEVKRGDTLTRIANRFDTTVSNLLQLNPSITNRNLIRTGQRLMIPVHKETGPRISITPLNGPPETEVRVVANGFPPATQVEVGLGPWESEYNVVRTIQTDTSGQLTTQVTIPSYAETGDRWAAVVVTPPTPDQPEDRIKEVSNPFTVTAPDNAPIFSRVDIYLTALEEGDVGCNDAIVPVALDIVPTQTPLIAAIQELLSLDERLYGQSGLYNALHRSDLELEDVSLENGKATIRLTGDYQAGGICDDPRIAAQLRQTALQFETVDKVQIYINEQPLQVFISQR